MATKDIIAKLLVHENLSASAFAKSIGITPTQIYDLQSGKIKKISANIGSKIVETYPHYRLSWLLTGEGEMLNGNNKSISDAVTQDTTKKKTEKPLRSYFKEKRNVMVPLINIDSVGGMHSQNFIEYSEQYMERMVPFPDARPDDVAILQSGDSMSPTIPPGAIMQIRRVEDWQEYFGYGNVYVLWLRDGRRITKLVKRYEPDSANFIMCCSYNPEADDEELPKSMILEVWKVVNVLINKGW
ncbi:LexA family transcriptional regulator [Bacteroides caecimuris]|uniref:LexA family transcriptional regulator n=1 Tax=Bacteroides caecimuris TaxID=1796613 RepID=UPI002572FE64|nr:LexA family transcriptional regulator [Bacteroides caecimuris]